MTIVFNIDRPGFLNGSRSLTVNEKQMNTFNYQQIVQQKYTNTFHRPVQKGFHILLIRR